MGYMGGKEYARERNTRVPCSLSKAPRITPLHATHNFSSVCYLKAYAIIYSYQHKKLGLQFNRFIVQMGLM